MAGGGGVFCLPCVLHTLQQLSSAVPAHCTLHARSIRAAVLQRWWRCCEGSHHHNIQDFPRLAPPPALHAAWDCVGVESGFCKVAVACPFTGCLSGCRFAVSPSSIYQHFKIFSCYGCLECVFTKQKRRWSVVAAGWGVWVSLWQHNRGHNNLRLLATTSHRISTTISILYTLFCLGTK